MSVAVRPVVLALAAGLLTTLPVAAQDLADQIQRLNQIAAQKAEREIRDEIAEAVKLVKDEPAKALEKLLAAQDKAEKDAALTDAQRAALKRSLQTHLRIAERNLDALTRKDLEQAQKRLGGEAFRADDQRAADQARIGRDLARVRELRLQGRLEEADRIVNDLAQHFPDHPSVRASRRVIPMADRARDSRRLVNDRERRLLGVYGDIERSSIPPIGDVQFPSNWRELTQKRAAVQLTAKEKAILKAFDTPIKADFTGQKFEEVIDYLQQVTGVTILLDKASLEQAMVAYDTPVKFNARGVSLRTVLRRILGDLGLTYIVKDEMIQVTTPDRARETLTVRTYYLGDLVAQLSLDLPPALNELAIMQNAAQVIDLIQHSVEPQSWQINNGPGTIVFDPARLALIVKQTAEVHLMLGGGVR